MFLGSLVEVDVCPPEAVDRLLGVADEEEASFIDMRVLPAHSFGRSAARKQDRNFDLQRVGVLELVDQEMRKLLAHRFAHGRVVAQEVTRKDEQVVELQPPLRPALRRIVENEALDGGEERWDDARTGLREQVAPEVMGFLQAVAHLVY